MPEIINDIEAPIALLDARGLKCPLPVLKLEKRLAGMVAGEACAILADDPVARVDIPLMCAKGGHACAVTRQEDGFRFHIVKCGARPIEG